MRKFNLRTLLMTAGVLILSSCNSQQEEAKNEMTKIVNACAEGKRIFYL